MKVPVAAEIDDNAVEVIQTGLDYNVFNARYGGGLGLNDYIKAILFNKTGFVYPADNSNYLVSRQYVKNFLGNVEIRLSFILPRIEPDGEHKLWYRWAFYNPYTTINPYTGLNTC